MVEPWRDDDFINAFQATGPLLSIMTILAIDGCIVPIRVLLDGGRSLSVLLLSTARKAHTPMRKRIWKETRYAFNDIADETGGDQFFERQTARNGRQHLDASMDYSRTSLLIKSPSTFQALMNHISTTFLTPGIGAAEKASSK